MQRVKGMRLRHQVEVEVGVLESTSRVRFGSPTCSCPNFDLNFVKFPHLDIPNSQIGAKSRLEFKHKLRSSWGSLKHPNDLLQKTMDIQSWHYSFQNIGPKFEAEGVAWSVLLRARNFRLTSGWVPTKSSMYGGSIWEVSLAYGAVNAVDQVSFGQGKAHSYSPSRLTNIHINLKGLFMLKVLKDIEKDSYGGIFQQGLNQPYPRMTWSCGSGFPRVFSRVYLWVPADDTRVQP